MRLTGNVSMPEELQSLLKSIREKDTKPDDETYNSEDYLAQVPRIVDVLLLCVFYGLYRTQELPSPILNDNLGSYEFNVGIDREITHLRNILLMMWISENKDLLKGSIIDFRAKLYDFLKDILDDSYITHIVFPFYLFKAAEPYGDVSFINRLDRSRFVEWEMKQHAPERIALEFKSRMDEFEAKLADSLHEIMGEKVDGSV